MNKKINLYRYKECQIIYFTNIILIPRIYKRESQSKERNLLKENPLKKSPSKENPLKENPSKESPSKENPSRESPSKERQELKDLTVV